MKTFQSVITPCPKSDRRLGPFSSYTKTKKIANVMNFGDMKAIEQHVDHVHRGDWVRIRYGFVKINKAEKLENGKGRIWWEAELGLERPEDCKQDFPTPWVRVLVNSR